jgi:hypothetical protein
MTLKHSFRHAPAQAMAQPSRRARIYNGASFGGSIKLDQSQRVVKIARRIDRVEQIHILALAPQSQRNRRVALVHAGRRFHTHTLAHTPAQRLRKGFPLWSLARDGTCVANYNAGHFSQFVVQSETSYAC